MARLRKHEYIDVSINPKQVETLKAGHVVHKQMKGYEGRIVLKMKHPLDSKIAHHKQVLMKLMKEKRGYSAPAAKQVKPLRKGWSAASRKQLSKSMKAAHKAKPDWTS